MPPTAAAHAATAPAAPAALALASTPGSAAEGNSGTPTRELVREILNAFFTVHGELGFGFADSVYVRALAIELFVRRLNVAREVPVSMHYKGVTVGSFRAHLIVEDRIVVHVTAGEQLRDADRYQLLSFLRCAGKEIGLLLHFGPNAVARRIVPSAAPVAVEEAAHDSEAHLQ